ncbi:MAG: hypothetical protein V8R15_00200 [Bacilli bacterium]
MTGSQSSLNYTFTSSNPSIATVSDSGTVMAKGHRNGFNYLCFKDQS